ncbi:uncharacterized protein LOC126909294 [Daktulosphaira vitifoliae]|uniref:uncharacterized protein LOC126909294 n=1 Tax=Daktulosphaira vitifoliae TaxID=58002 RepID=UPI0021AAEC4E|nr:uncharacterized protein LOC126909294 [Daktulosphaira vitifoliae]
MRLRSQSVLPASDVRDAMSGGSTSPLIIEPEGETNFNAHNSAADLRDIVATLVTQNNLLMQQLLSRNNQNSDNNTAPPVPPSQGYFIMPDFNNSISNFTGREAARDAQLWLQSVESVAKLHCWPDNFKLELVRLKLIGPSKYWYSSRQFADWNSFIEQFTRTFVGCRLDTVDRVRLMSNRLQLKNDCVFEYFHHKMQLCSDINLTFDESKRQIVEGLFSRDLCHYLLARDHKNEDELLTDIRNYEKIDNARQDRFRVEGSIKSRYTPFTSPHRFRVSFNRELPAIEPRPSSPPIQSSQSTPRISSRPRNQNANVRCFNCGSISHYSSSCPARRDERRPCYHCQSGEHQSRQCPRSQRSNDSSGENVSILEHNYNCFIPPFMLDIRIKYPNGNISNVTALIDTGSPVSLLKSSIVPYVSGITPSKCSLVGINGSPLCIVDEFMAEILNGELNVPISLRFCVVPDRTIKNDCLLGRNFLAHNRVDVRIIDGQFTISFNTTNENRFDEILSLEYHNDDNNGNGIDIIVEPTLPLNIRQKIIDVYTRSYLTVDNATDLTTELENPPLLHIKLKTEVPIYFRPRRLSFFEKQQLQLIIDDLLSRKIIRPSQSEYSSPIILDKKKNGELRLCIDYREINKHMVKDR